MKAPVHVAVSGAAGRIANTLLFNVASGQLLGDEQPVILHLLETSAKLSMLDGVAMELHDGVFPLLAGVEISDDARQAFDNADYVFLISSPPNSLLVASQKTDARMEEHGDTFAQQGKALNALAKRSVKVLVVSNPVIINALIVQRNMPDLDPSCISAMMRLDHNRAHALLAHKTRSNLNDINKIVIWGNHSSTQYPDFHHATVNGVPASSLLKTEWLNETCIMAIRQRGYAIIDAYGGLRAAASAAKAATDHMRDWIFGTREGDWTSMGILSDGAYGVQEGIFFSYPVTVKHGRIELVRDLDMSPEALAGLRISANEIAQRCRQLSLLSQM